MKSLYFKLSLWSLGTLIVCVLAVLLTSNALNRDFANRGGPMGRTLELQAEGARKAYEQGGREKLAAYLSDLVRFFPEKHLFLNAHGRDLITGDDRSETLHNSSGPRPFPPLASGKIWIARATSDSKYRMLMELDPPASTTRTLPYLLVILFAIGLFSYALFRYLVSPLRTLSEAVRQFGQGNFAARARIRRGDEFGEVAAQFNEMASRIETLLAAERRLLEDVSHELRSPLARMQFALELVRTSPDREAALQKMRREIDRLSELVRQLLEVTRAEGDPQSRAREPVNLSTLASEIVEDCQIEAEAKQCIVQWTEPAAISMTADHELLRRSMENVLRNAIRYAPDRSSIEVSLRQQAGMAQFMVRDHGTGVPDELLTQIFEPFYRVDSSRTSGSGGVGLGLSIVKRSVGLHNGTVKVTNANPGLRVALSFPLKNALS